MRFRQAWEKSSRFDFMMDLSMGAVAVDTDAGAC